MNSLRPYFQWSTVEQVTEHKNATSQPYLQLEWTNLASVDLSNKNFLTNINNLNTAKSGPAVSLGMFGGSSYKIMQGDYFSIFTLYCNISNINSNLVKLNLLVLPKPWLVAKDSLRTQIQLQLCSKYMAWRWLWLNTLHTRTQAIFQGIHTFIQQLTLSNQQSVFQTHSATISFYIIL